MKNFTLSKTKIIAIALIILGAGLFFGWKTFFVSENEEMFKENIPHTFVNKICSKISKPGDFYYCLAVANQDESFCQNQDEPNQRKLCQAMATRNIAYCREIQESGPKKMCYYELSFLTGEFDYCDEVENPNDCYFAFIHRLHWESRNDEIKLEYCEKINDNTAEGLIFKNCCQSFRGKDSSLCQGNKYCLSYFKQPLSFCDAPFETPEGLIKYRDDCLVDRAMSEKDSFICAEIEEEELRDLCYGNFSTHIYPNISLCEKITDEMKRNMCYAEYAIYFAKKERDCVDSGGKVIIAHCCDSTEDFPHTCAIGACTCLPKYSREVKICDCGEKDRCFDGNKCVNLEEHLKERGMLNGLSQPKEEAPSEEKEEEVSPVVEEKLEDQLKIPVSHHIENPPYYREDGFCWGGSAIMLMMDRGLTEIEGVKAAMKSGLGGTPDMFRGFVEFGVIDKVRIAYSKDYIEEFADFYNRRILVRPEEQVILLDDSTDAFNQLKELISSDILVIAGVHYGNHFVVVTGYDENYIYINDPGFDGEYDYEKGYYEEQSKISSSQFLKEWGISKQYKSMSHMEGAIGWPGDYGMIWLEK